MTSHEDDETIHRSPKAGKEQIPTYVEAVKFLLKSYAKDSSTARKALETAFQRKTPAEISVQFADVLCTKVFCCENAYHKKRAKKVCNHGLLASIQSSKTVRLVCTLDAHLSEIALYAGMLLQQTWQVPGLLAAQIRKSCFDKGQRTSRVAATIDETQRKVSGRNNHSNQKQVDGFAPKKLER